MNILTNPRYFSRRMSPQQKLEASRSVTDTSCWESTYTASKNGYAHMTIEGKAIDLHRLAYELYIGPIPEKIRVLHTCDNTRCHNPAHLFLGTAKDNTQDMLKKGRHVIASPLTEKQVRKIRKASGSLASIAEKYGVSKATISNVKNRKTWKHID